MQRALVFLCVLGLAACSGAGAPPQTAMPITPSSDQRSAASVSTFTAWNVQAGASTLDYAVQDLDFYPKTITINAGDSITWRVAASEPHTVSFLAPGQSLPPDGSLAQVAPAGGSTFDGTTFTSSGQLNGGQRYTLKFVKAGTYTYFCLFHHPEMEGTIVVNRAGSTYPHNAQYYLHVGANDEWEDLLEGDSSVHSFPFTVGGNTLAAGIDPGLVAMPPPDSTVLRFLDTNDSGKLATSGNKTIKVGSTLTFVNETSNEPHTVTIPPAGQTKLPPMNPFAPPSGGTAYDGTALVNSGVIPPGAHFSVKFTKAGTYFYGCLFHDDSGMVGTITVKT